MRAWILGLLIKCMVSEPVLQISGGNTPYNWNTRVSVTLAEAPPPGQNVVVQLSSDTLWSSICNATFNASNMQPQLFSVFPIRTSVALDSTKTVRTLTATAIAQDQSETVTSLNFPASTRPPLALCSVYGLGHIVTFDSQTYDVTAVGDHYLARDVQGGFAVQMRIARCNLTICPLSLAVYFQGSRVGINLRTNASNQYEVPKLFVLDADEKGLEVIQTNDGTGMKVLFPFGGYAQARVWWNDNWKQYVLLSASVALPSNFSGSLSGLCGNYDGNAFNDNTAASTQASRVLCNASLFAQDVDLGSLPSSTFPPFTGSCPSSSVVGVDISPFASHVGPLLNCSVPVGSPPIPPPPPCVSCQGTCRRIFDTAESRLAQVCATVVSTNSFQSACNSDAAVQGDVDDGFLAASILALQEQCSINTVIPAVVRCPSWCTVNGNCDFYTAVCTCSAGYLGSDCLTPSTYGGDPAAAYVPPSLFNLDPLTAPLSASGLVLTLSGNWFNGNCDCLFNNTRVDAQSISIWQVACAIPVQLLPTTVMVSVLCTRASGLPELSTQALPFNYVYTPGVDGFPLRLWFSAQLQQSLTVNSMMKALTTSMNVSDSTFEVQIYPMGSPYGTEVIIFIFESQLLLQSSFPMVNGGNSQSGTQPKSFAFAKYLAESTIDPLGLFAQQLASANLLPYLQAVEPPEEILIGINPMTVSSPQTLLQSSLGNVILSSLQSLLTSCANALYPIAVDAASSGSPSVTLRVAVMPLLGGQCNPTMGASQIVEGFYVGSFIFSPSNMVVSITRPARIATVFTDYGDQDLSSGLNNLTQSIAGSHADILYSRATWTQTTEGVGNQVQTNVQSEGIGRLDTPANMTAIILARMLAAFATNPDVLSDSKLNSNIELRSVQSAATITALIPRNSWNRQVLADASNGAKFSSLQITTAVLSSWDTSRDFVRLEVRPGVGLSLASSASENLIIQSRLASSASLQRAQGSEFISLIFNGVPGSWLVANAANMRTGVGNELVSVLGVSPTRLRVHQVNQLTSNSVQATVEAFGIQTPSSSLLAPNSIGALLDMAVVQDKWLPATPAGVGLASSLTTVEAPLRFRVVADRSTLSQPVAAFPNYGQGVQSLFEHLAQITGAPTSRFSLVDFTLFSSGQTQLLLVVGEIIPSVIISSSQPDRLSASAIARSVMTDRVVLVWEVETSVQVTLTLAPSSSPAYLAGDRVIDALVNASQTDLGSQIRGQLETTFVVSQTGITRLLPSADPLARPPSLLSSSFERNQPPTQQQPYLAATSASSIVGLVLSLTTTQADNTSILLATTARRSLAGLVGAPASQLRFAGLISNPEAGTSVVLMEIIPSISPTSSLPSAIVNTFRQFCPDSTGGNQVNNFASQFLSQTQFQLLGCQFPVRMRLNTVDLSQTGQTMHPLFRRAQIVSALSLAIAPTQTQFNILECSPSFTVVDILPGSVDPRTLAYILQSQCSDGSSPLRRTNATRTITECHTPVQVQMLFATPLATSSSNMIPLALATAAQVVNTSIVRFTNVATPSSLTNQFVMTIGVSQSSNPQAATSPLYIAHLLSQSVDFFNSNRPPTLPFLLDALTPITLKLLLDPSAITTAIGSEYQGLKPTAMVSSSPNMEIFPYMPPTLRANLQQAFSALGIAMPYVFITHVVTILSAQLPSAQSQIWEIMAEATPTLATSSTLASAPKTVVSTVMNELRACNQSQLLFRMLADAQPSVMGVKVILPASNNGPTDPIQYLSLTGALPNQFQIYASSSAWISSTPSTGLGSDVTQQLLTTVLFDIVSTPTSLLTPQHIVSLLTQFVPPQNVQNPSVVKVLRYNATAPDTQAAYRSVQSLASREQFRLLATDRIQQYAWISFFPALSAQATHPDVLRSELLQRLGAPNIDLGIIFKLRDTSSRPLLTPGTDSSQAKGYICSIVASTQAMGSQIQFWSAINPDSSTALILTFSSAGVLSSSQVRANLIVASAQIPSTSIEHLEYVKAIELVPQGLSFYNSLAKLNASMPTIFNGLPLVLITTNITSGVHTFGIFPTVESGLSPSGAGTRLMMQWTDGAIFPEFGSIQTSFTLKSWNADLSFIRTVPQIANVTISPASLLTISPTVGSTAWDTGSLLTSLVSQLHSQSTFVEIPVIVKLASLAQAEQISTAPDSQFLSLGSCTSDNSGSQLVSVIPTLSSGSLDPWFVSDELSSASGIIKPTVIALTISSFETISTTLQAIVKSVNNSALLVPSQLWVFDASPGATTRTILARVSPTCASNSDPYSAVKALYTGTIDEPSVLTATVSINEVYKTTAIQVRAQNAMSLQTQSQRDNLASWLGSVVGTDGWRFQVLSATNEDIWVQIFPTTAGVLDPLAVAFVLKQLNYSSSLVNSRVLSPALISISGIIGASRFKIMYPTGVFDPVSFLQTTLNATMFQTVDSLTWTNESTSLGFVADIYPLRQQSSLSSFTPERVGNLIARKLPNNTSLQRSTIIKVGVVGSPPIDTLLTLARFPPSQVEGVFVEPVGDDQNVCIGLMPGMKGGAKSPQELTDRVNTRSLTVLAWIRSIQLPQYVSFAVDPNFDQEALLLSLSQRSGAPKSQFALLSVAPFSPMVLATVQISPECGNPASLDPQVIAALLAPVGPVKVIFNSLPPVNLINDFATATGSSTANFFPLGPATPGSCFGNTADSTALMFRTSSDAVLQSLIAQSRQQGGTLRSTVNLECIQEPVQLYVYLNTPCPKAGVVSSVNPWSLGNDLASVAGVVPEVFRYPSDQDSSFFCTDQIGSGSLVILTIEPLQDVNLSPEAIAGYLVTQSRDPLSEFWNFTTLQSVTRIEQPVGVKLIVSGPTLDWGAFSGALVRAGSTFTMPLAIINVTQFGTPIWEPLSTNPQLTEILVSIIPDKLTPLEVIGALFQMISTGSNGVSDWELLSLQVPKSIKLVLNTPVINNTTAVINTLAEQVDSQALQFVAQWQALGSETSQAGTSELLVDVIPVFGGDDPMDIVDRLRAAAADVRAPLTGALEDFVRLDTPLEIVVQLALDARSLNFSTLANAAQTKLFIETLISNFTNTSRAQFLVSFVVPAPSGPLFVVQITPTISLRSNPADVVFAALSKFYNRKLSFGSTPSQTLLTLEKQLMVKLLTRNSTSFSSECLQSFLPGNFQGQFAQDFQTVTTASLFQLKLISISTRQVGVVIRVGTGTVRPSTASKLLIAALQSSAIPSTSCLAPVNRMDEDVLIKVVLQPTSFPSYALTLNQQLFNLASVLNPNQIQFVSELSAGDLQQVTVSLPVVFDDIPSTMDTAYLIQSQLTAVQSTVLWVELPNVVKVRFLPETGSDPSTGWSTGLQLSTTDKYVLSQLADALTLQDLGQLELISNNTAELLFKISPALGGESPSALAITLTQPFTRSRLPLSNVFGFNSAGISVQEVHTTFRFKAASSAAASWVYTSQVSKFPFQFLTAGSIPQVLIIDILPTLGSVSPPLAIFQQIQAQQPALPLEPQKLLKITTAFTLTNQSKYVMVPSFLNQLVNGQANISQFQPTASRGASVLVTLLPALCTTIQPSQSSSSTRSLICPSTIQLSALTLRAWNTRNDNPLPTSSPTTQSLASSISDIQTEISVMMGLQIPSGVTFTAPLTLGVVVATLAIGFNASSLNLILNPSLIYASGNINRIGVSLTPSLEPDSVSPTSLLDRLIVKSPKVPVASIFNLYLHELHWPIATTVLMDSGTTSTVLKNAIVNSFSIPQEQVTISQEIVQGTTRLCYFDFLGSVSANAVSPFIISRSVWTNSLTASGALMKAVPGIISVQPQVDIAIALDLTNSTLPMDSVSEELRIDLMQTCELKPSRIFVSTRDTLGGGQFLVNIYPTADPTDQQSPLEAGSRSILQSTVSNSSLLTSPAGQFIVYIDLAQRPFASYQAGAGDQLGLVTLAGKYSGASADALRAPLTALLGNISGLNAIDLSLITLQQRPGGSGGPTSRRLLAQNQVAPSQTDVVFTMLQVNGGANPSNAARRLITNQGLVKNATDATAVYIYCASGPRPAFTSSCGFPYVIARIIFVYGVRSVNLDTLASNLASATAKPPETFSFYNTTYLPQAVDVNLYSTENATAESLYNTLVNQIATPGSPIKSYQLSATIAQVQQLCTYQRDGSTGYVATPTWTENCPPLVAVAPRTASPAKGACNIVCKAVIGGILGLLLLLLLLCLLVYLIHRCREKHKPVPVTDPGREERPVALHINYV